MSCTDCIRMLAIKSWIGQLVQELHTYSEFPQEKLFQKKSSATRQFGFFSCDLLLHTKQHLTFRAALFALLRCSLRFRVWTAR
jgi:hypothetical protein